MKRHPREGAKAAREGLERQLGRPVSRRDFLRYGAGAAVSVPALSAILAACGSNPRTTETAAFEVATRENPVRLPVIGEPIADNLEPEKGATLQLYNWDAYIWQHVIKDFCAEYDCDYEITTFNNMEEAVGKIQTGQLEFDVWFPTYDQLGKFVEGGFIMPLNHSYIPNLEANAWDVFQNPFYDQEWQYSVPYTVYTTGIAYRRDRIGDDEVSGAENPRALLWDSAYADKVGVYDSYRDTLGFALQKLGINDLNTEDAAQITQAKDALIELIDAVNVRATINGAYAKLPKGEYTLHESWSGDIVAGWGYTPKYTQSDYETLGYWSDPDVTKRPADNDLIVVGGNAKSPVLAHLFLNWMLDFQHAMDNFSWNGYQPPQKQADPDSLTSMQGLYSKISGSWAAPITYVPEWMSTAVVREDDLAQGLRVHELSPDGDQRWNDAWQEFKAGA